MDLLKAVDNLSSSGLSWLILGFALYLVLISLLNRATRDGITRGERATTVVAIVAVVVAFVGRETITQLLNQLPPAWVFVGAALAHLFVVFGPQARIDRLLGKRFAGWIVIVAGIAMVIFTVVAMGALPLLAMLVVGILIVIFGLYLIRR